MDRFVARVNIEHFREALAIETDEEKRHMLANLLADEEAKLKIALEKAKARTEKKA